MKLPKVGTRIKCRLLGASDHHALQEHHHTVGACSASPTKSERREPPFLLLSVSSALNGQSFSTVQDGKGKNI